MGETEISDVFQDALGAELNEILDAYAESTKDNQPGAGPFACGQGEPIEWNVNRAAWEGDMECSDSHTIGRYHRNGKIDLWRRWRVEITAAGIYDIHVSGGSPVMTQCLTTPTNDSDLSPPFEGGVHVEWQLSSDMKLDGPIMLQTGVYELRVEQDGDDQGLPFSVELLRQ